MVQNTLKDKWRQKWSTCRCRVKGSVTVTKGSRLTRKRQPSASLLRSHSLLNITHHFNGGRRVPTRSPIQLRRTSRQHGNLAQPKHAVTLISTRTYSFAVRSAVQSQDDILSSTLYPSSLSLSFLLLSPLGKVVGDGRLWTVHDRICSLHGKAREHGWVS